MQRVTSHKTSALDKMRWSRVVIAAGQACNSVLREVEMEALKKQVEELKALTMAKLGDEQGTDQEGHPEASADA